MAEHASVEKSDCRTAPRPAGVTGAVIRGGLWWPEQDRIAYEDIAAGLPFLQMAVDLCQQRRTVIQAGGNAGMYPVYLAARFARVVTAEPHPLNFRCLEANTVALGNVECVNAALGVKVGRASMVEWAPNSGCQRVVAGNDIHMLRLDDLGVDDCDLLQLDIEGFELDALMGGMRLIEECRPVIMLEQRGHGADPEPFLATLGYEPVLSSGTDVIYRAL